MEWPLTITVKLEKILEAGRRRITFTGYFDPPFGLVTPIPSLPTHLANRRLAIEKVEVQDLFE